MAKWSKAQHAKYAATCARKASEQRRRIALNAKLVNETTKPVDAHYVGQQQAHAADISRLEERAFRRGMFTAFQMIIDLFLQELR